MHFICDFCNKIIPGYNKIYLAFDCKFCSSYCSHEIYKINIIKDPNISHPERWINKKPTPKILENTVKRTQSLMDLLNNLKLETKV